MLVVTRSAVVGLAFLASSVSAQQVDPRLVEKLDASTRMAVIAIIDSARATGLPTEPLVDKALEGAARKAPSQRIVSAVRTFRVQLDQARGALGAASSPMEVLGGAQAIRAGISSQQLERLRGVRAGARIAAALTVAADIAARGVPVDTAVAVVSRLVQYAATDDQMLAVRASIETDILSGLSPAVAAATRSRAVEQTLADNMPPNGAVNPGALPSASGTSRPGDPAGNLKPPASASGRQSPTDPASKPPVKQRKRP